jgi:hypothetical protein
MDIQRKRKKLRCKYAGQEMIKAVSIFATEIKSRRKNGQDGHSKKKK